MCGVGMPGTDIIRNLAISEPANHSAGWWKLATRERMLANVKENGKYGKYPACFSWKLI
jgi:hypothetical protein